MAKLEITLKKSVIGSNQKVRDTVKALGFSKTNDTVIQEDSPAIRGMIRKIGHMVTVNEVS
jgi:large subunit ribosomal protein L30